MLIDIQTKPVACSRRMDSVFTFVPRSPVLRPDCSSNPTWPVRIALFLGAALAMAQSGAAWASEASSTREKTWLAQLGSDYSQATDFFAGCTLVRGGVAPRTLRTGEVYSALLLSQISGRCRGHTFSPEPFPASQVLDDHSRCEFELLPRVGKATYWNVRFCNVDGQLVSSIALLASTGAQLTTEPWLTPEQVAESALTPTQRAQGPTWTRLTAPAGIPGEPTDQEAAAIGWAVLGDHWRKCGESYVSSRHLVGRDGRDNSAMGGRAANIITNANIAMEMKGLTAEVTADDLSRADRMNGIRWRGSVAIEAELYRGYIPIKEWGKPGWGPWRDEASPLTLTLSNVNGVWGTAQQAEYGSEDIPSYGVYLAGYITAELPKPATCDSLPR